MSRLAEVSNFGEDVSSELAYTPYMAYTPDIAHTAEHTCLPYADAVDVSSEFRRLVPIISLVYQ